MVKKLLTFKVICWWSQQWHNLICVTLDMVFMMLTFKYSLTISKWNWYVSFMKTVKHLDFRRANCLIVFSPCLLCATSTKPPRVPWTSSSLSTWQIMDIQKSLLNTKNKYKNEHQWTFLLRNNSTVGRWKDILQRYLKMFWQKTVIQRKVVWCMEMTLITWWWILLAYRICVQ